MRKALLVLVGTAVLWVPAASIAGGSPSSGSKPPAKTETPAADSPASNPATTCRSQQSGGDFAASHNGKTFSQFYATNGGKGRPGANAFGKCVSGVAKQRTESDGKDTAGADSKDSAENHTDDGSETHSKESASPALACKAMKANDLAHFQTTYGSRPNDFGHCVAAHASGKKRSAS